MSLSLYVHIPFCRHRCSYCDFNTYTSLGDLKEVYAAAVCRELAQAAGDGERNGRFTPCSLAAARPLSCRRKPSCQILAAADRYFARSGTAEITMEANPGTVDADYLAAVAAAGVNRLSFGVQSAVASELALLEREHDFAAAVEAVRLAREAGLTNFNLDLIYGLPGQTLNTWRQSLTAALALDPPHISLYCLTIEPGTPMQRWLQNGRIQLPDPDLAADQYQLARDLLASMATSIMKSPIGPNRAGIVNTI
jgi:oxygen-independent coproporphyrinogen III oxidase